MTEQRSCVELDCVQKCCNSMGYCPSSGTGPDFCTNFYSDYEGPSSKNSFISKDEMYFIIVSFIVLVLIALLVCFIVWMLRILKNAGFLEESDYTWNQTKEIEAPKLQKKKSSKKQQKNQENVESSKDLHKEQEDKQKKKQIHEIESYLKQQQIKDHVEDLKASQKIRRIKKKKSLYLQEQVIMEKQHQ